MADAEDNRVRQGVIGIGILLVLSTCIIGLLAGWRSLPGLMGEWIGTIVGVMTTPFFLEASFFLIGLVLVITLNHWRQHREGDEFVYLDQVEGPDLPAGLPDRSSWVVYREAPLPMETPSMLSHAEGAFAIGDYPGALKWIEAMDEFELKQRATLKLRLQLAQSTGKSELAEKLLIQLQAENS